MKIKLELFGASRDFSNKNHLELEVQDKASVDDLKDVIIKYLNKNFKGNESFIKIVKSSKDKSQLSISEFTYLGNAATIQLKSNEQIINVNLPIEDLQVFKKGDYVDIEFPKGSAQVIDY